MTLAGRTLGPYNVLEEIGRGGMGIVYAAEDTRLGRQVALQALPPDVTRIRVAARAAAAEARAAASLTHPSIATVYALEELDGELYIVSSWCADGPCARNCATARSLPSSCVRRFSKSSKRSPRAHAQGIVHRDLNPRTSSAAPTVA